MMGEKCHVVILRFFNTQKTQDFEWLSRELADSIVGKLKAFFDISYCDPRTVPSSEKRLRGKQGGKMSKAQLASLAHRIGADLVVVGSYACAGDMIRVDIQAMRPSTDKVSAPFHFERPADGVCLLEKEMAAAVAELLGRRLGGVVRAQLAECPTGSRVAFEELCKGKQAPEGSYSKIRHFQKAIAADPNCAEAHYLLGNAYCNISMAYRYTEWFSMALEEYRKAAAIAPNRAEIYYAMGVACMMVGRYSSARKTLEKALEIDPGMKSAGGYLMRLERMGF